MMQIHFPDLHSPTRCSMFVAATRFEVYRRHVKETPDGHVMTGAGQIRHNDCRTCDVCIGYAAGSIAEGCFC